MRRCARESHNGLLKLLKKQVSSRHADSRRRGKKENKKAGWATPPHPITVTSDFLDRFYISKTHRTLAFTCWQLVVKAGVLDGLWSAALDLYSIFKKAAARCHFSLWSALPFLKVTVWCPPHPAPTSSHAPLLGSLRFHTAAERSPLRTPFCDECMNLFASSIDTLLQKMFRWSLQNSPGDWKRLLPCVLWLLESWRGSRYPSITSVAKNK